MYDYSSSSSRGLGYDTATHNTEPPLFTFQSNLYFQLFLHRVDRKEGIHTETDHQKTYLVVRPLFIYCSFSIMTAFWQTNLVIGPQFSSSTLQKYAHF